MTTIILLVSYLIGVLSPVNNYISGLKETFMKRHTVGRTNKAKRRPEEHSQKTDTCGENLWNEIQLKGP